MKRIKPTTSEVDHSCQQCGVTPPSWGTLVVVVPGRNEYLCAPCYEATKADTIRKAA